MKFKKIIVYLLSLIFVAFLYAEFEFKISQEFKKGEGEITITGKTTDEVWTGIARTLISLKCKIVEKDEDIGFIIAERKGVKDVISDSGSIESTEEYVSARWQIMIESLGDEVIVTCSYEGEGTGFWGSKKKSFINFCTRLKKFLDR